MKTREILDEFVENQGWDDDSIISLLCEFIELTRDVGDGSSLRNFLQAQTDLENGAKIKKARLFKSTRFGTCRGCNAEETELQRRAGSNLDRKSGVFIGEYLCISCYLFNEHMAVNPDCESCKAQTCKFISGDATNDDL